MNLKLADLVNGAGILGSDTSAVVIAKLQAVIDKRAPEPVVTVIPMLESHRKTWWVQIRVGNKTEYTHQYDEHHKNRADYEAARLKHLFGQGERPPIMDYEDTCSDGVYAAGGGDLPSPEPIPSTRQPGLYTKFEVHRTDGTDAPGGKHHGCDYFVLDVTHDKCAPAALAVYAAAVEGTHPQLAADMRSRWGLTSEPVAADPAMPVVAWVWPEEDCSLPCCYTPAGPRADGTFARAVVYLTDAQAALAAAALKPVDMILHCPACLHQHIDAPEPDIVQDDDPQTYRWTNPPHRSRLCGNCGFVWRPADVPTNGVETIKTRGKNDMVLIDGPAVELERLRRLDGPKLEWDDNLGRACSAEVRHFDSITRTEVQPAPPPQQPLNGCAAGRDGDCTHSQCPQLRDREPATTGRSCPLWREAEES